MGDLFLVTKIGSDQGPDILILKIKRRGYCLLYKSKCIYKTYLAYIWCKCVSFSNHCVVCYCVRFGCLYAFVFILACPINFALNIKINIYFLERLIIQKITSTKNLSLIFILVMTLSKTMDLVNLF